MEKSWNMTSLNGEGGGKVAVICKCELQQGKQLRVTWWCLKKADYLNVTTTSGFYRTGEKLTIWQRHQTKQQKVCVVWWGHTTFQEVVHKNKQHKKHIKQETATKTAPCIKGFLLPCHLFFCRGLVIPDWTEERSHLPLFMMKWQMSLWTEWHKNGHFLLPNFQKFRKHLQFILMET